MQTSPFVPTRQERAAERERNSLSNSLSVYGRNNTFIFSKFVLAPISRQPTRLIRFLVKENERERERGRRRGRGKEKRHGSPARSSAIDSSRTRAERKAFSRMTFAHSRRLDADRSPTDHPLRSRDVIVEFLPRQSAPPRSFPPFPSFRLSLSPLPPQFAPPIRSDAKRVTRMIVCTGDD